MNFRKWIRIWFHVFCKVLVFFYIICKWWKDINFSNTDVYYLFHSKILSLTKKTTAKSLLQKFYFWFGFYVQLSWNPCLKALICLDFVQKVHLTSEIWLALCNINWCKQIAIQVKIKIQVSYFDVNILLVYEASSWQLKKMWKKMLSNSGKN